MRAAPYNRGPRDAGRYIGQRRLFRIAARLDELHDRGCRIGPRRDFDELAEAVRTHAARYDDGLRASQAYRRAAYVIDQWRRGKVLCEGVQRRMFAGGRR